MSEKKRTTSGRPKKENVFGTLFCRKEQKILLCCCYDGGKLKVKTLEIYPCSCPGAKRMQVKAWMLLWIEILMKKWMWASAIPSTTGTNSSPMIGPTRAEKLRLLPTIWSLWKGLTITLKRSTLKGKQQVHLNDFQLIDRTDLDQSPEHPENGRTRS